MNHCRHFHNHLADYVFGRLNPTEAEAMKRHAQQCERCARALEEETSLRTRFADAPRVTETPDIWPQLAPRLTTPRRAPLFPSWAYGSGLAASAAAFGVLMVMLNRTPVSLGTPTVVQPPPAPPRVSIASAMHELQDFGVSESQLLLTATSSSAQMGRPIPDEGGEEK